MNIGEIVNRVKGAYQKGVSSVSSRLTDRHIYSKVSSVRSKLLGQEHKKNQTISDFSYQVLPCIEMIETTAHECGCIPPLGFCILRSKYPIPRTITGMDKDIIKSVTSLDGSLRFDHNTFENIKFKKGNKYTSSDIDFYIRNGYLFITSQKYPEVITMSAIFEDVVEAASFPSYCEEEICIEPLNVDFYVENDLVDAIVELANLELVKEFNKFSVEDKSNNATDTPVEQAK